MLEGAGALARYFHSVQLDPARCKGCTNCIKRCPTEAIRVRDGKARIIEERCIDCGECIRVCPNHAKSAITDDIDRLSEFDYNIALPAPALFGQFAEVKRPEQVLNGLLKMGFDEVFEVPLAADYVSVAVREYIAIHGPGPWISSSCPAIVRLIQVRYPELLKYLLPMETPMEIAAVLARGRAVKRLQIASERVGVWFITPCPAKVTAIHQPEGRNSSCANGAFAITDVYGELIKLLPTENQVSSSMQASGFGLGWGRAGGESAALGIENRLAVDGVHSLLALFDEMERGKLREIGYLECQACVGGCVGGALTVDNPFLAKVRLTKLAEQLSPVVSSLAEDLPDAATTDLFALRGTIEPRPIMPLAGNMLLAIRKMEQLEQIAYSLPGLDCGACGAPSCRALAEDIVRGIATETDCVLKLRERMKDLAAEIHNLAEKLPPAMGRDPHKRG
ncbi:MAG: [Fe-Fe] hydrogenase large subunit C-terminal domain-containing protein [Bacillota bacterium]|jgi:Na+-translocating ferredoxin:NAD+ oxidoreductase RNF subunit RnfB